MISSIIYKYVLISSKLGLVVIHFSENKKKNFNQNIVKRKQLQCKAQNIC